MLTPSPPYHPKCRNATVLELMLSNMHLHFWDLGGSSSVRTLWSKYYDESDAIMWVVDARHFLALQSQHTQNGDHKGKGKAKALDPDVGSEAYAARESSWKLLCKCQGQKHRNLRSSCLYISSAIHTAELLMHPSLDGRPILIVANKADECESIPTDLARTIKNWFAKKLAHIDEDPEQASIGADAKAGGNIFADEDDQVYGPRAGAGSTLNERGYEWDVLLASATEG